MQAISLPDPPPSLGPSGPPAPSGGAPAPTPPPGVPVRDRLLGAAVVLVLVALLAGTAVWRVTRDDESAAPTTTVPGGAAGPSTAPSSPPAGEWPAEVQPLVAFVERARGGPFDRVVPIEFLTPQEYRDSVTALTQDTTPEDRIDTETWAAGLRALGLLEPGTDVEELVDQMYGEGTLAYYDDDDEVIRVLGTDVDVAHRATLVHELTHAWQDQHGFLEAYDDLEGSPSFILQTLVEGDASRIEDLYVETLSSGEMSDYLEQSAEQAEAANFDGVPPVMMASLYAPYALGAPLTTILAERGGNAAVDEAMAVPPRSESALMSARLFFADAEPVDVAEPALPDGAERLDGGDFGAFSWFLLLSERVDPRQALAVADAWAGDDSVTYRVGDRVCLAASYRGATSADTDTAAGLLSTWADGMAGHDAIVEREGDVVVVRSCESPTGTTVAGRSEVAVQYPVLRLQATLEVLGAGASFEEADCFGDAVVDAIGYDELATGSAFDRRRMAQISGTAARACFD